MKNLTIETITAACRGTLHGSAGPAGREAAHVVIDSRKAGPGDVFVAINGERVDGHTFIPSVMEKGALCAVSEQDLGERDFPSNAVAPPIFQTSIFCFKSFEDFQAALAGLPRSQRDELCLRRELPRLGREGKETGTARRRSILEP